MVQNWFNTLHEALASEDLQDSYPNDAVPIGYGETRRWTWDNGTKYGHLISVSRNTDGMYERPVHYDR